MTWLWRGYDIIMTWLWRVTTSSLRANAESRSPAWGTACLLGSAGGSGWTGAGEGSPPKKKIIKITLFLTYMYIFWENYQSLLLYFIPRLKEK